MSEFIVKVEPEPGHENAIRFESCVPLIRCADCEYYHDGKNTDGKRYVEQHCLAIGELAFGAVFEVDEHDFCSWAKRRVDK